MRQILAIVDGAGIYGSLMHYMLVMAFVGSAFLAFLYFWRKGKLDMDEGPKYQMMQPDEQEGTHESDDR
jgi:hypothetical protein